MRHLCSCLRLLLPQRTVSRRDYVLCLCHDGDHLLNCIDLVYYVCVCVYVCYVYVRCVCVR
ncbi:hypothetical protein NP493_6207g00000 [Ridgeia piscesae]|uniref:Uncharacterized protein n=1 Tax=Ridgeia piscesae TaxID=27915 RepID=A0AAD9IS90_RIDPI|nr:hypothetical protein NP493_6207g00000 [Ridgeia piscesae]